MTKSSRTAAAWIALVLPLAAVVHLAIVLAIPYAVGIRLRSMSEANTIIHGARPTADYNPVRRSSPDLIYSVYSYDLSAGPLRVTAPVPETYASVSCFALNTDNYYVKNDRQVEGSFGFVLAGPGTPNVEVPDVEVVRSPTTTGGILFRYFVGDGTHEEQIENIRRKIRITELGKGG